MSPMLKIILKKSPIGYEKSQGRTAQALGLRRLNAEVLQADTPVIRGMIRKIRHLVEIQEVAEKES
ncbi:MAG: 50S ribosomal protein L30 [Armatimonadetes bacterium]|nr:50S ribosomal protein L30 [Armatimonadota bacterium]